MAKKVVKKITKIEPVSSGSAANVVEVKRVCAYCRVSTNSADQKNSFEAQVDYYTRLIGEKRAGYWPVSMQTKPGPAQSCTGGMTSSK